MEPGPRGKAARLPPEVSGLVGRGRELGEVKRRLSQSRLVTLTGAGGTGKSRLAVRVGEQLQRAFADGAWFVDLTHLRDPGVVTSGPDDRDDLAQVIADVLGCGGTAGASPVRTLTDQLADRRMLLILDNCEHVLASCGAVAGALLAACPQLRILATSREPLYVSGEALYPLSPLPVPAAGAWRGPQELGRCESVALFLLRARARVPEFELTADNDRAVAELCRCLDGLPLAIELAAARVPVLAPQQILERLADGFRLLNRGSAGAPERQRTLRACMDWSFDLCTEPERLLWSRLSVFTGTFELDAVEGVCADEQLPAPDCGDLLAALVDKSVVTRADHGEETARFTMLETIRTYGRERLHAAGEACDLRRRHRDWFGSLVARARSEWATDRQVHWLARLGREHPNLRAAVECCLGEPGQAERALRIATTIPLHYWWARGRYGEVRRWLDRGGSSVTEPSPMQARALLVDSQFAFAEGDAAAGARLLRDGEHLARRLGAREEIAHAVNIRGVGALFAGDLPAAVAALSEAWTVLSSVREREPDLDLRMNLLIALGVAAGLAGDAAWAQVAQREMRAVTDSQQAVFYRASAHWVDAIVAWCRGDLDRAERHAVENLRLARAWASVHRTNVAMGLEILAWITAGQGRHHRAATLLGGAAACFAATGVTIAAQRQFAEHHDACQTGLRARLGDPAFADAFGDGQARSLDAVLDYAVAQPHAGAAAPASPASPDVVVPLSAREREIADLIAQGLSNKAIAARLVISRRTAEGHVARVMTKLGCRSRAQVAALMVATGPPEE